MKENWVWNLFMALEVSEGYWSLVFTFGQTSIIKSMQINHHHKHSPDASLRPSTVLVHVWTGRKN